MLLIMVCIASLLVPAHHRLEKWVTQALVEKNKKIRLAAAKKTIARLEGKGNIERQLLFVASLCSVELGRHKSATQRKLNSSNTAWYKKNGQQPPLKRRPAVLPPSGKNSLILFRHQSNKLFPSSAGSSQRQQTEAVCEVTDIFGMAASVMCAAATPR